MLASRVYSHPRLRTLDWVSFGRDQKNNKTSECVRVRGSDNQACKGPGMGGCVVCVPAVRHTQWGGMIPVALVGTDSLVCLNRHH